MTTTSNPTTPIAAPKGNMPTPEQAALHDIDASVQEAANTINALAHAAKNMLELNAGSLIIVAQLL